MDNGLTALFRPRSVAVIGASSDPNKIGGRPIHFLKKGRYRGAIYPVNRSAASVQGIGAFPSLQAIGREVDQAIIAVPAKLVLPALEQCVAARISAVQIFTAGFAEAGEEGRALQAKLVGLASANGVRLLGPNTLGIFGVADGFFGTFATALDGAWPRKGTVAIATQSGAFGSYAFALASARGIGFSYFVATGNEGEIDVADCIAWLADDPSTKVILASLEGCKDGDKLRNALALALERRKPVIAMKVGATDVGAAAAVSHTGSLAGSDAVFDAVFRTYGVHRARSLDEMVDLAYTCSTGTLPADNRLAIITTSGGIGVLMADAASQSGLTLEPMPESVQEGVKAILPFASGANPVDTTAALISNLSLYAGMLELILTQAPVDTVIGYLSHVGRNPQHFGQLKEPLFALRRRFPSKLMILCMLADEKLREELEAEGFLVFEEPTRCVLATAAAARIAQAFKHGPVATPALPAPAQLRGQATSEAEAKKILRSAGIPVNEDVICSSADEAAAAAERLGFPVAIKLVSPDIAHKTEIGGVVTDVADPGAARRAFTTIHSNAAASAPGARIDGASVSRMISGGVEVILGVTHDAVFGPVVMFGLGGIFVEVFKDVAFRVAPIGKEEALEMIREVRGYALLAGARGRPPCDLEALADALARLSQFAAANRDTIESADINPFVALPQGGCAVDAFMVPRTAKAA